MAAEGTENKLFIGGLAWETSSESLRSGFEKFGAVETAEVIRERETGRSKGFGFVTFTNRPDAEAAVKEMNGQEFEGRSIRVDFAAPRGGGSGGRFNGPRDRDAPYERRGGGRGGFRGDFRGGRGGGGFRGGYGGGNRDRYGDRD